MSGAERFPGKMRLSELLRYEIRVSNEMDVMVKGVESDSRRLERGELFFACKGKQHDGRKFIPEVIARGASAILLETDKNTGSTESIDGVPVFPFYGLSEKMGEIAARFYQYPANNLCLIGITGTNGKTSAANFLAQSLSDLGYKCGISGTLGHGIYGKGLFESKLGPSTTPDAVSVQKILHEVLQENGEMMVMEVSSHGLHQHRVNIHEFDVAIFTNLSRDHLDYHGGMKAYGEAKKLLFTGTNLKLAIVNSDDQFSASILNSLSSKTRSFTYSLHNPKADNYPRALEFKRSGFSLDLVTPWGEGCVQSSLLGEFNVSNFLAMVMTVLALEVEKPAFEFRKVLARLGSVKPVKGRMEIVGDYPVSVVVDYAHTPDALKNALEALALHFKGKIWCVFGCGGDRDQGKRAIMAECVEKLAHHIVVTNDNPRNEDPAVIIRQIFTGFSNSKDIIVEQDRAMAIDFAISHADEGDVVLIAGKGHEEFQEIAGRKNEFNDVSKAMQSLIKRFDTRVTTV